MPKQTHAAKVTKKSPGEFELTRTVVEVYDRTGLAIRRRHAEAELSAVQADIERLKQAESALLAEIAQIDALLASD